MGTVNFHFFTTWAAHARPNITTSSLQKKVFICKYPFLSFLFNFHFFPGFLTVNFHFSPLEPHMHPHTSQGRLSKKIICNYLFTFTFTFCLFSLLTFTFCTFTIHMVSLAPSTFHAQDTLAQPHITTLSLQKVFLLPIIFSLLLFFSLQLLLIYIDRVPHQRLLFLMTNVSFSSTWAAKCLHHPSHFFLQRSFLLLSRSCITRFQVMVPIVPQRPPRP